MSWISTARLSAEDDDTCPCCLPSLMVLLPSLVAFVALMPPRQNYGAQPAHTPTPMANRSFPVARCYPLHSSLHLLSITSKPTRSSPRSTLDHAPPDPHSCPEPHPRTRPLSFQRTRAVLQLLRRRRATRGRTAEGGGGARCESESESQSRSRFSSS